MHREIPAGDQGKRQGGQDHQGGDGQAAQGDQENGHQVGRLPSW
ncbi:hypothetical protein ABGV17_04280 [Guyparkeria sp. GHLCS8-2]